MRQFLSLNHFRFRQEIRASTAPFRATFEAVAISAANLRAEIDQGLFEIRFSDRRLLLQHGHERRPLLGE